MIAVVDRPFSLYWRGTNYKPGLTKGCTNIGAKKVFTKAVEWLEVRGAFSDSQFAKSGYTFFSEHETTGDGLFTLSIDTADLFGAIPKNWKTLRCAGMRS